MPKAMAEPKKRPVATENPAPAKFDGEIPTEVEELRQQLEEFGVDAEGMKDPSLLLKATQYIVSHQGPMPPPGMLKGYDEVVPGFAAKIADNFSSQSDHRRRMEKAELELTAKLQTRGQLFGFCIAGGGLLLAALVASYSPWPAGIIAIAAVGISGVPALIRSLLKTRED